MKKYKYREHCSCGKEFKSNWKIGATSVRERILTHRIKEHGYVPTNEERNLLGSVA